MPIGGGKYDREVEKIIQEVEGDLVLLLVVGGKRGNGFSVCARPPEGLRHMAALPDILAYCSGEIREDVEKMHLNT